MKSLLSISIVFFFGLALALKPPKEPAKTGVFYLDQPPHKYQENSFNKLLIFKINAQGNKGDVDSEKDKKNRE